MTVNRINPQGVVFTITKIGDKVEVRARNKVMLMNMGFEKFIQCWYNWQMQEELIQNAFPDLPMEDREFLMTTITPQEWKEIFASKSHVKD